jgi:uncharacterized protein
MFVVDIDCHMSEPFSSFAKYLPENFRKEYRKVKALEQTEQYKEDYRVFTGESSDKLDPVKVALLQMYYDLNQNRPPAVFDLRQGGRIRRPELKLNDMSGMKHEQVVDTFVKRFNDIGIKRAIIFPNMMLGMGQHPDRSFEVATSNAFADYMLDQFLDKYPELLTCVVVPANSPDKAADLIDRVGSEKGIVGAMVTTHRPTLAGDDAWIPIYEAATRKNLPICFHASQTNLTPYSELKNYVAFYSLGFPFTIILHLTSLLTAGMHVRYPKLKFVFIEGGVTWIPWIMHRLDTIYPMFRSETPLLTKMPSEYIKEFYYSSQPLETPLKGKGELEYYFKSFNASSQLMYASDYPHFDFDTPGVINNLPFLSGEEKKNILGENARRVFRLGN